MVFGNQDVKYGIQELGCNVWYSGTRMQDHMYRTSYWQLWYNCEWNMERSSRNTLQVSNSQVADMFARFVIKGTVKEK